MTTKTVKRDLLAAADYIGEHGWCRNDFLNEKGQACLAGAVAVVTGAIKPSVKRNGDEAWDWSAAQAPRLRYGRALTALALQLNTDRVTQLLADFDERTRASEAEEWFTNASPAQQAGYRAQRAAARSFVAQDIVTTFNDKEEIKVKAGTKPTIKRTTKAQAVKLLQRAAAA